MARVDRTPLLSVKAARKLSGAFALRFRQTHFAGFPTIRAVVQPIHAESHVLLRLAETAVLFAVALRLRLVALRADGCFSHRFALEQFRPGDGNRAETLSAYRVELFRRAARAEQVREAQPRQPLSHWLGTTSRAHPN